MDEERRAFYRWHASLMEPWDGPAALIFTDGVAVGAALDRNGLRPLRYWVTDDGLVVCASEAGVVDLPGARIRRGKLGPGQMIVVDPREGGFDDDAIRGGREPGTVGVVVRGASRRALARDAPRRVGRRRRALDAADPPRLHAGGPEHDAPTGGRAREGANVLHG